MNRDGVVDELYFRLCELSEQLSGEVHDPDLHVDPCAALNLFVGLLGPKGDWRRTLLSSPCACGGKTPLAEVEVFVEKDEIQHLIAGASQIYFGLETTPRSTEIPVRILVFDLPGGKPCS